MSQPFKLQSRAGQPSFLPNGAWPSPHILSLGSGVLEIIRRLPGPLLPGGGGDPTR